MKSVLTDLTLDVTGGSLDINYATLEDVNLTGTVDTVTLNSIVLDNVVTNTTTIDTLTLTTDVATIALSGSSITTIDLTNNSITSLTSSTSGADVLPGRIDGIGGYKKICTSLHSSIA